MLVLEELGRRRARGADDPRRDPRLGVERRRPPHHRARRPAEPVRSPAWSSPSPTPASGRRTSRHINAHGTSTPLNDAAEAEAHRQGLRLARPAVTSTKGVTGHALGAAGRHRGGGRPAVDRSTASSRRRPAYATPTPSSPRSTSCIGAPRPWEPGPVAVELLRLRRPQRLARPRARVRPAEPGPRPEAGRVVAQGPGTRRGPRRADAGDLRLVRIWGAMGARRVRGRRPNLITPARRRAAAAEVRVGLPSAVPVSCRSSRRRENPRPALHLMTRAGDDCIAPGLGLESTGDFARRGVPRHGDLAHRRAVPRVRGRAHVQRVPGLGGPQHRGPAGQHPLRP